MLLSAVFYPLSALPEALQPWLGLNPLIMVIEQSRAILVRGKAPSWNYVFLGSFMMLIICKISYRLFQRGRRGFVDIL